MNTKNNTIRVVKPPKMPSSRARQKSHVLRLESRRRFSAESFSPSCLTKINWDLKEYGPSPAKSVTKLVYNASTLERYFKPASPNFSKSGSVKKTKSRRSFPNITVSNLDQNWRQQPGVDKESRPRSILKIRTRSSSNLLTKRVKRIIRFDIPQDRKFNSEVEDCVTPISVKGKTSVVRKETSSTMTSSGSSKTACESSILTIQSSLNTNKFSVSPC